MLVAKPPRLVILFSNSPSQVPLHLLISCYREFSVLSDSVDKLINSHKFCALVLRVNNLWEFEGWQLRMWTDCDLTCKLVLLQDR